jgi:hypothetical protein
MRYSGDLEVSVNEKVGDVSFAARAWSLSASRVSQSHSWLGHEESLGFSASWLRKVGVIIARRLARIRLRITVTFIR